MSKQRGLSRGQRSNASLFDFAIEAEQRAREMYAAMADLFLHVPAVSAFWRELMEDEDRHILALRQMRGALSPEQLSSRADPAALARVRSAHLAPIEPTVDSIQTLEDAYEIAHEREFSEVNEVFAALSTQFIPAEDRRRFYLAKLDQHQRKLATFTERFGDARWRGGISARRGNADQR